MSKKQVEYFIRSDGLYLAYLQSSKNENIWVWDESYRTKEEFEKVYKDYEKRKMKD